MPLSLGNSWTYQVKLTEDGVPAETTLTLTVEDTWSYRGSVYYVVGGTGVARNHDQGLTLGSRDASELIRDRLFAYPVEDDTAYLYTGVNANRSLNITVSEENISVGAGTFDCLQYTYSDTLLGSVLEYQYCFVPDIGFVMFRATGLTQSSEFLLESYSVK
jgi:hypothetical protein